MSPDEDARYQPQSATRCIHRREVPEKLEDLYALRRRILPELGLTPYVEQEHPAVCSW